MAYYDMHNKTYDGEMLTTVEVARRLNVHRTMVVNYIKSGKLLATNVSYGAQRPRYIIRESDLDMFINSYKFSNRKPNKKPIKPVEYDPVEVPLSGAQIKEKFSYKDEEIKLLKERLSSATEKIKSMTLAISKLQDSMFELCLQLELISMMGKKDEEE